MVKYTGRGLVVKRPGVLSKVQLLNFVLGVGVLPSFQAITAKIVAIPLAQYSFYILNRQGQLKLKQGEVLYLRVGCREAPYHHASASSVLE